MNRIIAAALTTTILAAASPAAAWGDLGHRVTALIAYKLLTPKARAKVDG